MNNEQLMEKKIIARIKNSMGYSDAVDKDAFMAGAMVAMSVTMQEFEPVITIHEAVRETLKRDLAEVKGDMSTLSGIIYKYQP